MALITVPSEPTPTMLAAGGALDANAAAVWRAMIAARPIAGGAAMVARLPTMGSNHRNPGFWADLEVRQMVIENHRQATVQQLRALIADRCGIERTPSKSALARAWQRLDLATVKPGYAAEVR